MLIICNGMNRSGSTYQFNLVRRGVQAADRGEVHGYIPPTIYRPDRPIPDDLFIAWAEAPEYHVVKFHVIHPMVSEVIGTGKLRLLYIYRDLRDVAVSLRRVRGVRGQALLGRLDELVTWYYGLANFREQWPDYVLWQKYETVMADPRTAAREIYDFLDIDVDPQTFEEILADCSVDAAKKRCDSLRQVVETEVDRLRKTDPRAAAEFLVALGRGERAPSITGHDDETLLRYDHVSNEKGAPGTWKKLLPRAERGAIEMRYADWFRDAGYALSAGT